MLGWLAQNAVIACALAGVVALVCRLGRPAPAVRHVLWLVVLLKLITPPLFVWPWPVTPPVVVAPVPVVAPELVVVPEYQPARIVAPKVPNGAPRPIYPPPQVRVAAPSVPFDWLLWLERLWLGCIPVVLAVQLRRLVRLRRLASWGRPANDWLVELVQSRAAQFGVSPPRVRLIPGRGSPFLWCCGRPTLLVPAALLSALPRDAWGPLIAHELAHLKRRDHWVSWLLLPAAWLWWWFPLFWLARRQVGLNAELACDAWAVGCEPDQRAVFARALIEVSRGLSAAPAPAVGAGASDRRAFERRLTMILHESPRPRMGRLGFALAALLAAIAWPCWTAGAAEDTKPATGSMPKPLDADEALAKAKVNGKYVMLLRQFKAEADFKQHNAFADVGLRDQRSHSGQTDLPKGYWVYVYPTWYIFRDETAKAAMKPKRNWGHEQVTGEPDTPQAGDIVTAWASRSQDDQDESLTLEYAQPVQPKAVIVHETYNPGALYRVTAFKADGTEVEIWKGSDPTPAGEDQGVSVVPVKVDFKTSRIKIHLKSTEVPGWNEIDAVGVRDGAGKTHWAVACEASSNYAQDNVPGLPVVFEPVNGQTMQRLMKLEREVEDLKKQNKELTDALKEIRDKMPKGDKP